MNHMKKWLAGCLAALMLLSVLTAAITVGVSAEAAAPTRMLAYSESAGGRGPSEKLSDFGLHLHMGGAFNKIAVSMATWNQTGASSTYSLYKWDKNAETTVKAAPVATVKLTDMRDNAFNELSFDEQPAGDYYIRIHDVQGEVSVWQRNATVGMGYMYVNGTEMQMDMEMYVYFTAKPETPFIEAKPEEVETTEPAPEKPVDPGLWADHKVMPDTWVFTDGLGRESLTHKDVGDPREGKTLAMFYWDWHTELSSGGAVNTTELMKKYPDAKNDYNHEAWKGKGRYCFWNEPIYGFYRTDDAWVLRRQAELLANAGVDTIFNDNTNGGFTWKTGYTPLFETWDDARVNGAVHVPKISFMLPFGATTDSKNQIQSLYRDIYGAGKYPELWFRFEDKPMLMAYNNFNAKIPAEKEINQFFTWRSPQPSYYVDSTAPKSWGWLSVYPQALYSKRGMAGVNRGMIEQMTVGVAQNHNYVYHELTAMNGENICGRSYTSQYPDRYEKEGSKASLYGYNFAEQFDYALTKDPEVLFVTGWNEWHAWRQPSPWGGEHTKVNNALVDQFDNEFSRDLEPTKGELQDHYYYQFVNYARRFKGVNPIPTPSLNQTIDLTAGAAQWDKVEPYYAAYVNNTGDRDARGYGNLHYTETSGRNDIMGARIARDDAFVYFFVECLEDITPYTDDRWMNLYIDCDQKNAGWNTFDFVINKTKATANTVVLEKFTDGYRSEKVADCAYVLDGRFLTVKVAKSDLGLTGDNYTINFAWTDNVHDEGDTETYSGDIMDFYISGDVAPGGRFKYSYVSAVDNAREPETTVEEQSTQTAAPETDAPAPDTTAAVPAETVTETVTETAAETEAGRGCKSTMAVASFALLIPAALILRRKKSDGD